MHNIINYFIRFVEYGTLSETTTALQDLNGMEIENSRISVKVSEKKENRASRMHHKKEMDRFYSTLNVGKNDKEVETFDDFEMDNEEASLENPLSGPTVINTKQPSAQDNAEAPPLSGISVIGSRENMIKSYGISKPDIHLISPSEFSQTAKIAQDKMSENKCTFCGKPCAKKCTSCRAPYCNVSCQRSDWSRHSIECKKVCVIKF